MPLFYNPNGNVEVWDTKPVGYMTEAEWRELHPELFPEPELTVLKQSKQEEITRSADRLLSIFSEKYGAMEITTWDQQYAEAIAYQANASASVPLLDAIANARGMDVASLAQHVIVNRAEWVALSGSIVGQRLAYRDALDAATTAAEIEGIKVKYILPPESKVL